LISAGQAEAEDAANRRPGGRPKTLDTTDSGVQGFAEAPTGNSVKAALRRLAKHRPDLHHPMPGCLKAVLNS
jgi:hypothetical protein